MNLPCILKTTGCHVVCLFENGFGYHMDGCYKGIMTDCKFSIAGSDKNITTEYLANTYGEVKSKEYAEFIVKLCKGTEIDTTTMGGYNPKLPFFNIYKEGDVMYLAFWGKESACITEGEKQITIPLPPECEGVDEWPKVGDDAILTNENDYEITRSTEAIGEKVKVMSLFKDGDLDMAAIKHDITNYCFRVDMLQKPKTPEQELRDEISDLAFNQFNDDSYDLTHNSYYLAEQLISKYNITKKGEGDE